MEKQIIDMSQLGAKNVSSTLKGLEIGVTVLLPNYQYSAIQGAKTRIQIELGYEYTTKYNKEDKTVSVLRKS